MRGFIFNDFVSMRTKVTHGTLAEMASWRLPGLGATPHTTTSTTCASAKSTFQLAWSRPSFAATVFAERRLTSATSGKTFRKTSTLYVDVVVSTVAQLSPAAGPGRRGKTPLPVPSDAAAATAFRNSSSESASHQRNDFEQGSMV